MSSNSRKRINSQASLTAENTFCTPVEIRGNADISASGISDSTVTVQRSFDGGVTYKDVEAFTDDFEKVVEASDQAAFYRAGIKTGDYGTDTVVIQITQ